MRLVELDPRWAVDADVVIGGTVHHYENRHGMAISFNCPCCLGTPRATRLAVWFSNPIDGMWPTDDATRFWARAGVTFETLSLSPSIDASSYGHAHISIIEGEVV